MSESPLKVLENVDPEFVKLVGDTSKFALSDGALPKKFKLLIAMALDASEGSSQGVKSYAQQAMLAGATKKEVVEALRVAQLITGIFSTYTAAQGLKEIF